MRTVAIIPALNEYQRLTTVVTDALKYVDEVVVIDDGSKKPLTDFLPSQERVKVLRHIINLGKGAALKTGVTWALKNGFQAAVFIDADGQHDPREIPSLLAPIKDRTSDVVFGVRKFHRQMPFVARLGNIFLTRTLQLLYRIKVDDTQSGFRALYLPIYQELAWRSPRYAVETEMIVNAGKHHVRYSQVPITTIYLDKYKGTTAIDGVRILINMITWRFI